MNPTKNLLFLSLTVLSVLTISVVNADTNRQIFPPANAINNIGRGGHLYPSQQLPRPQINQIPQFRPNNYNLPYPQQPMRFPPIPANVKGSTQYPPNMQSYRGYPSRRIPNTALRPMPMPRTAPQAMPRQIYPAPQSYYSARNKRYPTYPTYSRRSGSRNNNGFPFSNNLMPFGNTGNNNFFPFSNRSMPFNNSFNRFGNNGFGKNNSNGFGMPSNPMNNMFGNRRGNMPFFNNSNKKRKKAWGKERNIWPDFYTDFTDEGWDTMMSGPRDLGRMPGGWRFPYLSTPDPVTVSDAIVNQFPPIAEEAGNMADVSDWGAFKKK